MPIKLKRPFRPDLGDEVANMIEDFCNAHHDANPTEIVRKAVRDFIPRDLFVNEGAKRTYEALQSARKGNRKSKIRPLIVQLEDRP